MVIAYLYTEPAAISELVLSADVTFTTVSFTVEAAAYLFAGTMHLAISLPTVSETVTYMLESPAPILVASKCPFTVTVPLLSPAIVSV